MVVEIFWHAARILMLGNKLLCVQTFFWPRRHCVYERASLCVYVHAQALLIFFACRWWYFTGNCMRRGGSLSWMPSSKPTRADYVNVCTLSARCCSSLRRDCLMKFKFRSRICFSNPGDDNFTRPLMKICVNLFALEVQSGAAWLKLMGYARYAAGLRPCMHNLVKIQSI